MNDLGIIIAITGIGVAVVGCIISMMFWCRQQSDMVIQSTKEEIHAIREESNANRREVLDLIYGIKEEIKDFHYQLLEIKRDQNEKQKGQ